MTINVKKYDIHHKNGRDKKSENAIEILWHFLIFFLEKLLIQQIGSFSKFIQVDDFYFFP